MTTEKPAHYIQALLEAGADGADGECGAWGPNGEGQCSRDAGHIEVSAHSVASGVITPDMLTAAAEAIQDQRDQQRRAFSRLSLAGAIDSETVQMLTARALL